MLEVVTLTRASALFPDIDSCHVFIVSLYLFDSVPRQAESSVLQRLSVSSNLVISTGHYVGLNRADAFIANIVYSGRSCCRNDT